MSEATETPGQQLEQVVEQGNQETVSTGETAKADNTYIDFNNPDDFTPEKVQARMGEITRKGRDRERELKAELQTQRERAAELEKQALEASKPLEVAAPDADLAITDPDAFTAQQQRREQYLIDQEQHKGKLQQNEQALRQTQEQAQQTKVNTFMGNAQKDGISIPELNTATSVVVNAGINSDVAEHLMSDNLGPQLILELAKDPMRLAELTQMSNLQAGALFAEMSKGLVKQTTSPPPPPETIGGNGKAPDNSIMKYDTGAKFK
jgi:hypothetical protein